jgi:hypothetical protein
LKSIATLCVDRRQLLAGGATAFAAVATAAGGARSGMMALADSASVVLHDHRIAISGEVRQRLTDNGAQVITLTNDPVRMWRSQVGVLLSQHETRLLGVTRWPEFLLVSGLAAESRRHVRYQRLDTETGGLTWLIY